MKSEIKSVYIPSIFFTNLDESSIYSMYFFITYKMRKKVILLNLF